MSPAGRPPTGPGERPYVAAPFVVVRTPLLPLATLVAATATQGRLRALLADPLLREGVALADDLDDPAGDGPSGAWDDDDTLRRWIAVASAMAWPWSRRGLPAAALATTPGARTRLAPACATSTRRRTRIALHALAALCASLRDAPPLRDALPVRRGHGVFLARGGLVVVESTWHAGARRDALMVVEPDARWGGIVEDLTDGASRAEAAGRLARRDPTLGDEGARELVDDLVAAAILVPDLAPSVTGGQALAGVIAQLHASAATSTAAALEDAAAACARLDEGGLGQRPERDREVAVALRALGLDREPADVFRVTLRGPSTTTIGPGPVRDAEDAAALLARITPCAGSALVHRFCTWFAERHGEQPGADASSLRWLPLVDAMLDGPLLAGGTEPAPLLDGLDLAPDREASTTVPFGARERLLLRAIGAALQHRRRVWELDDHDVQLLAADGGAPPVEGLAVELTLVGPSDDVIDRDDHLVVVESVTGPSGVQGLASLAADDPELSRWVEDQLRAEEAVHGGAVLAELVHLPAASAPEVAERVVLRTHEIPVLGRSGAPVARQLPLDDLEVTVVGRRVRLRSRRLGREVILRHGGAPPEARSTLPFVDFLLALASGPDLRWSWGPLAASPFLPRVARGRVVLSRARWTLGRADLEPLGATDPSLRRRAGRDLRARLDLPRWVALDDDGTPVVIDLEHVVGLGVLAAMTRDRESATLEEVIAAPDDADVPPSVHGVIVPLVSTRTAAAALPPRGAAGGADEPRRAFAPGSEWLYAKLYVEPDAMVEVLGNVVAPALAAGRQAGVVTDWFFVRYADPHPHLRVRFRGDPAGLAAVVLPALHAGVAPRLARGAPWRFQIDTYEREIERYGGPGGIELAEAIFGADSDASLALLLGPGSPAQPTWRIALVGCATLLDDLGLEGADRTRLLHTLRAEWAAEHHVDARVDAQLAARFEAERAELERLLAHRGLAGRGGDEAETPFDARSRRLRPLVAELDARARGGRLTGTRRGLAASLLHMHLNRLLGAPQRPQELVILDLLLRLDGAGALGRRPAGTIS